jgi:hypothetical protein
VNEPSLETRLETGDPAPEPTVPLTAASDCSMAEEAIHFRRMSGVKNIKCIVHSVKRKFLSYYWEHFNTIEVTNLTEQPHGNTSKFHNADVFVHPTSVFWSLNISYRCTQDFVFG